MLNRRVDHRRRRSPGVDAGDLLQALALDDAIEAVGGDVLEAALLAAGKLDAELVERAAMIEAEREAHAVDGREAAADANLARLDQAAAASGDAGADGLVLARALDAD